MRAAGSAFRSRTAAPHRAPTCPVASGAAAAAVVGVTGCGWWSEQGRTTKGAAYGTGAGAATGAAIGAALGGGEGAWKGAAVGAALGALGGGLIGHYMDNQAKEMQKVVDRQDRVERDGESLRLSLASRGLVREFDGPGPDAPSAASPSGASPASAARRSRISTASARSEAASSS